MDKLTSPGQSPAAAGGATYAFKLERRPGDGAVAAGDLLVGNLPDPKTVPPNLAPAASILPAHFPQLCKLLEAVVKANPTLAATQIEDYINSSAELSEIKTMEQYTKFKLAMELAVQSQIEIFESDIIARVRVIYVM